MNTELEALYFEQEDRSQIASLGSGVKRELLNEGRSLVTEILREGALPANFDQAFDLLGNIGHYMAACRRHGLTDPDREARSPLVEASTLSLRLGLQLGVAPRLTTAHMQFANRACEGRPKRFTSLLDEALFSDFNTRAQFAFIRAADDIRRVASIGLSHPAALDLLAAADNALRSVVALNLELFRSLDVERFYFCVRPYFMTYRVGDATWRGANAGDFAGVNELDLRLGLCRNDDQIYLGVLAEKAPYLVPNDRLLVGGALAAPSLLDALIEALDRDPSASWLRPAAAAYLKVIKSFGATAAQHQNLLVKRFVEEPSVGISAKQRARITASGPELDVLLASLARLRDLRLAAPRDDIPTRHAEIARLQTLVAL
ncbi:monodechloroaminopyrrolnitrin synthase PrnB family protein [Mesorhizobium koreense]|uniref:monodechloroaminopyrrolnitrin synthase PrnB family protein n=1 Tax=Mesorhizobium koreense TaxID=3074855 RepID=UPI00287BAD89|nr:monodechloroaminopyrrolnitrin synthase PrnB family protein [Mesorhizobium sp. WR6]